MEPPAGNNVRTMKIGIVGSGNIGGTLGRLWAKAGHSIYFSFSRDRENLERLAQESGNDSQAVTPYDAVRCSEVVLFSVPWTVQDEAIKQIGRFEGQVVIDTTNPFIDDRLNVQQFSEKDSSSEQLARKLEGAKVIKAFNTLLAGTLRDRTGQGLVVFYAGDYPSVKQNEVAQLIRDAGFVPFDVGPLHEGKKQEPKTDRYGKELSFEQAEQIAGSAPQAQTTTGEIDTGAQRKTVT
jgi:8-hydroxy-5-deazaflavin:NADPH oxidoreductase